LIEGASVTCWGCIRCQDELLETRALYDAQIESLTRTRRRGIYLFAAVLAFLYMVYGLEPVFQLIAIIGAQQLLTAFCRHGMGMFYWPQWGQE
jgi:hypothetical protein